MPGAGNGIRWGDFSGHFSAGAAWNIGYGAGAGLGAVALGALAQSLGFAVAFGASAAVLAIMLPAAVHARRTPGVSTRIR